MTATQNAKKTPTKSGISAKSKALRWVAVPMLALTVSTAATASLMPGSIFGGGGIFGGGSSDGLFGNIGLGDIFNGGIGGIFTDIFGGNLGQDPNCQVQGGVIVNIAPNYDCRPDSVFGGGGFGLGTIGDIAGNILTGNPRGVFDSVLDVVTGELGIPSEITDVIRGRTSIGDALEGLAKGALGDLLGDNSDVTLGASNIPIYDDIEAILRGRHGTEAPGMPDTIFGGNGSGEVTRTSALATPNVNPALPVPTQALNLITDVVTARALSAEGQELAETRTASGNTANELSTNLSTRATAARQEVLLSAIKTGVLVEEQTSTQDTLKKALSAQAIRDAQMTEFQDALVNQGALDTQMSVLDLGLQQENYFVSAANAKNTALANEQTQKEAQQRIADRNSGFSLAASQERRLGGFAR